MATGIAPALIPPKRYCLQQLDQANHLFQLMSNLPKMPERAKGEHYRDIAVERARFYGIDTQLYESFFMAKIQEAVSQMDIMPFRFKLLADGASFRDLRDFLASVEEYLNAGVDLRPPSARPPSEQSTSRRTLAPDFES